MASRGFPAYDKWAPTAANTSCRLGSEDNEGHFFLVVVTNPEFRQLESCFFDAPPVVSPQTDDPSRFQQ
jgi:hypothetical protein